MIRAIFRFMRMRGMPDIPSAKMFVCCVQENPPGPSTDFCDHPVRTPINAQ